MAMPHDPEIQRLLGRQAINDCLVRYARGIDRHDAKLVHSAFHEDALDRHGEQARSPIELAAWGNSEHAKVWVSHQHFLTNQTVDFDGDTAHVETYVLFVQRRKVGARVDFGGARYVDRFERREGEWRIAARFVVMDWVCDADAEDPRSVLARYAGGAWDRGDASYERPLAITR
jgi:hypothetical protein